MTTTANSQLRSKILSIVLNHNSRAASSHSYKILSPLKCVCKSSKSLYIAHMSESVLFLLAANNININVVYSHNAKARYAFYLRNKDSS